MTALVIAEHENGQLKNSTGHTLSAALACDDDVHLLVAGHNVQSVADAAAGLHGVSKVLLADAPQLADGLAESVSAQVVALSPGYSHIFAPATAYGKNILPRVAAKLDVAQISD